MIKNLWKFKQVFLVLILLFGSSNIFSQNYVEVTDLADVTTDDYVVVEQNEGFAMSNSHTGSYLEPETVSVTGGNTISNPTSTVIWRIEKQMDGTYAFFSANSLKYISYTGSSNNIQVVDAITTNNQKWNLSYSAGVFVVTNAAVTSRILQYNSGAPRFVCYTSNQKKLLLFKKETTTSPLITSGSLTITNLNYNQGSGPSAEQSFTVTGSNLTTDITVTAPTNFEVATTSGGPFSGSVTLPSSGGDVYTRLAAGLSVGSYSGDITLASTGATDVNVALSGEVTPPALYYRSAASGDWSDVATWESSSNNVNWAAATATPTDNDNTITISVGHTVDVDSSVNVDELIINGVLQTANNLSVQNGTGDDVIVNNGGRIEFAGTPNFPGSSTILVKTGGVLSVSGGTTGSGALYHTAQTIYENASTLEYTMNSPAGSGVTFFPNADAVTIPTIRLTGTISSWGGTNETIVNGNLEVTSGASVTFGGSGLKSVRNNLIVDGDLNTAFTAVKIEGDVINNGIITVENNGNFFQSETSSYSGSGSFTLNKNANGAAAKYTGWSSPVVGQNLYDIYGTSTKPDYVMTYNSDTDYYDVQADPTTAVPGVGYSVKIPVSAASVSFMGTPINGTVNVSLDNTANTNGNTYNLIGNPYPSNLSLTDFYTANMANIGSTFYFWDPTSSTASGSQTGAQATVIGWATFNASGSGTWNPAASSSYSPTGTVAEPGQAFVVSATGSSASFDNSMRTSDAGNFFSKTVGGNKFWLRLTTPTNAHNTLAVTYGEGAQNTFDVFDSELNTMGSDAFFSTIGNEKLSIQGRSDFINTDVVPLGNKQFQNGSHVISLLDTEGIFSNGQMIILHDKYLGTYTDLQASDYTFQATTGEQLDRFEIVYQTQSALSTQEVSNEACDVLKEGEGFVAVAKDKITKIDIYDAAGRLVKSLEPQKKKVRFELSSKGVYVVKMKCGKNSYAKKVIK